MTRLLPILLFLVTAEAQAAVTLTHVYGLAYSWTQIAERGTGT